MDWINRMNKAIKYVEQNLGTSIDSKEIETITNCSYNHFIKVFYYMTNITLPEYIRNRKLTRAFYDLQNTDLKIIDIALEYGYESPTAFTRAFKNIYDMSPKEARNSKLNVVFFPPITFEGNVKGIQKIKYSIEEKEAFKIIGVKFKTSTEEDYHKKIALFWEDNTKKGLISELIEMNNIEPKGILGVSTGNWLLQKDFNYYIATASTNRSQEDLYELDIPKSLWVIFECIGPMPNALINLHDQIIKNWFTESSYEFTNLPDIEVYPSSDIHSENYKSEIWIPIRKI